MSVRHIALAAAVAAATLVPTLAEAFPGTAVGSVNLRAGPGTGYARLATIPAGATVDVGGCSSWCSVTYAGISGYASASYIARGYATMQPPPRFVRPLPPRFGFIRRPWWDDRYHAWYDGRRWFLNGRWYDRPSGFSFGFGFGG